MSTQEKTELSRNRSAVEGNLEVVEDRPLTRAEFHMLGEVPPEVEWLAKFRSQNTKLVYAKHIKEFRTWAGIQDVMEFRSIKRGHVIAWRDILVGRGDAPASIRAKLSALSSLYKYLCDKNAVEENPVTGVGRPGEGSNVGKTPAISAAQVQALLDAPDPEKSKVFWKRLKAVRDRAILSCYAFQGFRNSEVCNLKIKDIRERGGYKHFEILGKGEKTRYIPAHPHTLERITAYLEMRDDAHLDDWLFLSVGGGQGGRMGGNQLDRRKILQNVVEKYAKEVGIERMCVHTLRSTAGTNALENGSDIEEVQEWFGHSSIQTTALYDYRKHPPEKSPTFRVRY